MLFSSVFAIVILAGVSAAQDISLFAVKKAFTNALIPGNLSLAFDPNVLLEVNFPQPVGHPITLKAGIKLPRNATAGPPSFRVVGSAGPGPFVVATVDLDAPTPQAPTVAQIRHFLGGNFFLDKRDPLLLTNTTPAISNFLQPTPPAGSDPHRYVFLLFKQSKAFASQMLVTPTTSVALFNISSFASETKLGEPIGGTFMLVGPETPPST